LHYAARFWTLPSSWQAWGMLDAAFAHAWCRAQ
jgi:hypothetical protein